MRWLYSASEINPKRTAWYILSKIRYYFPLDIQYQSTT